jgi:hypothetical protein
VGQNYNFFLKDRNICVEILLYLESFLLSKVNNIAPIIATSKIRADIVILSQK